MSLLLIKIVVEICCAVCKLVGELWWHNAQRFIMPIILGIGVSVITHVWWLGFTVFPSIGVICLGYKDYGKSDGFDRGAWLAVICAVIGLGCVIFNHLAWYLYIPYIVLGGIWGGVTRNWWNVIIAPISGLIIGSMIWFVHP